MVPWVAAMLAQGLVLLPNRALGDVPAKPLNGSEKLAQKLVEGRNCETYPATGQTHCFFRYGSAYFGTAIKNPFRGTRSFQIYSVNEEKDGVRLIAYPNSACLQVQHAPNGGVDMEQVGLAFVSAKDGEVYLVAAAQPRLETSALLLVEARRRRSK
jgi:hypothetical protein